MTASVPPLPEPTPDPAPDAPAGVAISDPLPFTPIDDPVPNPSDSSDSAPDAAAATPSRGAGVARGEGVE